MSRWTPLIIGGLMLLGFVERQAAGWAIPSVPGHVAATKSTRAGTCLVRDAVLATFTANGTAAIPEPPPTCAAPSAAAEWYMVGGTAGVAPRHLAFDAAGCLMTSPTSDAPCP